MLVLGITVLPPARVLRTKANCTLKPDKKFRTSSLHDHREAPDLGRVLRKPNVFGSPVAASDPGLARGPRQS